MNALVSPLPGRSVGPLMELARHIEDSQASKDGALALMVQPKGGGPPKKVEIKLRKVGRFAPTFPYDCPRSRQMLEELRDLLVLDCAAGYWGKRPNTFDGVIYGKSHQLLALMAGGKPYANIAVISGLNMLAMSLFKEAGVPCDKALHQRIHQRYLNSTSPAAVEIAYGFGNKADQFNPPDILPAHAIIAIEDPATCVSGRGPGYVRPAGMKGKKPRPAKPGPKPDGPHDSPSRGRAREGRACVDGDRRGRR